MLEKEPSLATAIDNDVTEGEKKQIGSSNHFSPVEGSSYHDEYEEPVQPDSSMSGLVSSTVEPVAASEGGLWGFVMRVGSTCEHALLQVSEFLQVSCIAFAVYLC